MADAPSQYYSKNIAGVCCHLQQGIQCRQDNHGARDAVLTLMGRLSGKVNPQEFLCALRRVKLNVLADKLEHGR